MVNKELYVNKSISITKEQEEYIKKVSLNLSRFVQQKLGELIKNG